ncbi:MAG: T9SS type A sorting domain-containing protein [Candidatus Delongbacteria bacterium]|nr:T9SS type A sorting domain-containing protein [Candidatus Delongbacteria bacterium]
MKKYTLILFLLLICSLFAEIIILLPKDNMVYNRGEELRVVWSHDITGDVKIELFKSDEYLLDIATSTPSNSLYTWIVPANMNGNDYHVKITSLEDTADFDTSTGYFTLQDLTGSIEVLSPSAGEEIERSIFYNIQWTDNLFDGVKIDLYENDIFHSTIVDSTASDSSFAWSIPLDFFSTNFKLKITSTQLDSIYSFSEPFTVAKGNITILSPVGGETFEMLNNSSILWADNIPEDVYISLYKGSNKIISLFSDSDGEVIWNFYHKNITSGDDYKLRIESGLYSDIYDESNNFSIKGTNGIKGNISGTWDEENSPYVFVGNSYINPAKTLYIEPNTKVRALGSGIDLLIKGELQAQGEPDKIIDFEGINLNFTKTSKSDTSRVKYSNFDQRRGFFRHFDNIYDEKGYSVKQTSDNGYIICGFSEEYFGGGACVIKANSSGKIIWKRKFPDGNLMSHAYSITETSDGGYVFTGYLHEVAGMWNFWLVKLNSTGGMVWEHTYYGKYLEIARSVVETSDGGFVITGYGDLPGCIGVYDAILMKVDSNGNEEWLKMFHIDGVNFSYSVQQTFDGGFILTGFSNINQFDYNFWIIKIDPYGNKEWDKYFDNNEKEFAYSVKQTYNGDYILVGETSIGQGYNDLMLVKISNDGDLIWKKNYGGNGYDLGLAVQETLDGGYIFAGITDSYGSGSYDAWLLKTDSNGEYEWDKTFGGSNEDGAYDVIQTLEGRYAITGYTSSFDSQNQDVLLIVTDSYGNVYYDKTIEIDGTSLVLFQNNIIQNYGGYGITVNNACPVISNNLIVNNNGGIKFTGSSPLNIANNTIVDNDNFGLYFDGDSDPYLLNNIIFGNGSGEVYLNNDDSDPNFSYNNINGGVANFGLSDGITFSGMYENNINEDPDLLDASYAITSTSPCIDSGFPNLTLEDLNIFMIPQVDIAGNSRLIGNIDIGCYECQSDKVNIDDYTVNDFTLYQNYPNPFNPETVISYSLKNNVQVNLKVFNIAGREVCSLIDQKQSKGLHKINFNGSNLVSGIYFYRLSVDGKVVQSRKMMLLK